MTSSTCTPAATSQFSVAKLFFVSFALLFAAMIPSARADSAPEMVGLTNRVVFEDSVSNALTFTIIDYNTPPATNFTFDVLVTSNFLTTTNIVFGGVMAAPQTNISSWTLYVTPVTNVFGTNQVLVQANSTNDPDAYSLIAFTLAVTNVNDAPSFAFTNGLTSATNTSAEDTTVVLTNVLTLVSGGTNETNQTVAFKVQGIDTNIFGTNVTVSAGSPAATNARTMTLKPLTNAFGTNHVQIVISDVGTSSTNFVTNVWVLAVNNVNDAPAFGTNFKTSYGMLEDTVRTNSFTVTDLDTIALSVNLTFLTTNVSGIITGTNIAIVTNTAVLATNATGTNASVGIDLVITPDANAFGTNTVRVVVDDGSLFKTNTFTLTVTNVNDLPNFSVSPLTNYAQAGLPKTITNLVAIVSGGTNESVLSVTNVVVVSNTATSLFKVQPKIVLTGTNGNLTFTPKTNIGGSAIIVLRAMDNGGTNFGGINASTNITIKIIVTNAVTLSGISDDLQISAGEFKIESVSATPDGSVKLQLSNPSGLEFAIEYSTDLVEWKTLPGSQSSGSTTEVLDTGASDSSVRFYRAVGTAPKPKPMPAEAGKGELK